MTPLLQTVGWVLIHFLWQGAAIAAGASALLTIARRRSASVRYIIACVSLAVMVAAPMISARLLWTAGPSATAVSPRFDEGNQQGRDREHENIIRASRPAAWSPRPTAISFGLPFERVPSLDRVLTSIAVAWLIGVVLLLARMAGGWWRVRRLHHLALATRSSRWQTPCRRLAYRLGLPAAAHVVESALVEVPTVVGWLRPAILLPIAVLASLTPSQIEAILAHELAHIRRHDYAVNMLQTIAETLLFYHPAVWWLSNRVRVEREHCCDDIAIAVCGDPLGYARALAELETWRTSAASMALAATDGSLLERVRRILRV